MREEGNETVPLAKGDYRGSTRRDSTTLSIFLKVEMGIHAAEQRHHDKPVSTPLDLGDIFSAKSGSEVIS